MLCLSKNLKTLLYINFSKIFERQGRTDIGRWFEYDSLSFDLKIGVTTSTLSSLRATNDWLYEGSTMCLEIDLLTDTAAMLNLLDLRSIMGCPGGTR